MTPWLLLIGLVPVVIFCFLLVNNDLFGPALSLVIAYLFLTIIVVWLHEPQFEKDRRAVKDQIEACVDRGGTPIFALDDNTAEFFDCQEAK